LKHQFVEGPSVIRVVCANKCANRKFYKIVLAKKNLETRDPFIEELGSFDPLPNKDNQLVVALNLQRIKELISQGIRINATVLKLLGNSVDLVLDSLLPYNSSFCFIFQVSWASYLFIQLHTKKPIAIVRMPRLPLKQLVIRLNEKRNRR
jgi:ribosomal protein S16